jgi:plasmid replication initiation protein
MTAARTPEFSVREALEISRSLPGDSAAGDCPDLMGYPFFSLGEARRLVPICYQSRRVALTVEGTPERGIASIWDADILIWAASQIREACRQRTGTSRLLVARPVEILQFVGRESSVHEHDRLRAALDRLQSTSISTSTRQIEYRRRQRFSFIGEWKELSNSHGRWPTRISLMLSDWFYLGLLESTLSLSFDANYFRLKGGIERWLYRLVRFGEHQRGQFEILHLYARSGTLLWPAEFSRHVKAIAAAQALPGVELGIIRGAAGQEMLSFAPREPAAQSPSIAAPPSPASDQA